MPVKKYFNIHGCALEFSTPDPALADDIAFDLSAFACGPLEPQVKIAALPEGRKPPFPPQGAGSKGWKILRLRGNTREVWYTAGAHCEYDFSARSGVLKSGARVLLRELSYLLILSRAGEELDRRGLHRLHAGALGWRDRALLFCGARGTGKTTLLLELLKDTAFSLLSDDTPLLDADGTAHPFPVRIGLGLDSPHLPDFGGLRDFARRGYPPKRLLDPAAAGYKVSQPLPAGELFLLRRGARPRIGPAFPGAGALELAVSLAAGYGTPQLAEYFLRPSPRDMARKAGILLSRLRACAALLRRCRCNVFELGPDRAANAAELRKFLHSGSGGAWSRAPRGTTSLP